MPVASGNYTASRVGEGQILTNAPPQIAIGAVWRGFTTFGVANPTIDFAGSRVVGSTPMDLRSYGQNVTGIIGQDARGTVVSIRSESGMPLNLTDFGRSRGEQRGLTEHVEQALINAPPAGYLPSGMAMQNVPAQPSYAPPPPPVAQPYGSPAYNPYAGGYGHSLPTRRGGEVMTYALLSIFCCTFLAPIAWIRGNAALAEYGDQDPGDRGTVQAGRIIGMIMTVLMGIWLVITLISVLSSN